MPRAKVQPGIQGEIRMVRKQMTEVEKLTDESLEQEERAAWRYWQDIRAIIAYRAIKR